MGILEAVLVILLVLGVLTAILWWGSKFPEPELNDETRMAEYNVRRRQ